MNDSSNTYCNNYRLHHSLLYNFRNYLNESVNIPISFQHSCEHTKRINEEFNISSLVSDDKLETVINITNWVHNFCNSNHDVKCYDSYDTLTIMNDILHNKRSGNCKANAQILQDILLSCNIISKMIFCKPIDIYFTDCHVINHVYIPEINKWTLFDAAQNVYYTNKNSEILNLYELRDSMIKGEYINIVFIDEYERFYQRCTDKHMGDIKKRAISIKIMSYMCKNLFRFSQMQNYKSEGNVIIEYNLVPANYIEPNTTIKRQIQHYLYIEKFSSNPREFWKKPKNNNI